MRQTPAAHRRATSAGRSRRTMNETSNQDPKASGAASAPRVLLALRFAPKLGALTQPRSPEELGALTPPRSPLFLPCQLRRLDPLQLQRRDRLRLQIHHPNPVRVRVRHVQLP